MVDGAKPTGKWSRRSEARPAEITRAALALFAERGFALTKLEDVAKAAGISKGTIYLYFETKEELFRAVVRQELLPALEGSEAMVDAHRGTAGELIRLLSDRLLSIMDSDIGSVPKLVMSEAGSFPEIARFYGEEVVARGMRLVDRVLRRGVESGEFRPVPVTEFLPILIGPMLMMLLWKHSIGRHADVGFEPKAILATHVALLLRGLSPEEKP